MEAALHAVLPQLLGTTSFEVHQHRCKQQLLALLPQRLKGYAAWLPHTWRIVVIVDRDGDDCADVKARLERIARDARLATRSSPNRKGYVVVNRLAIEELEAWYFGDWEAVRTAYPRVSPTVPNKAGYRDPDAIAGGTWEAFERALQKAGYFANGLNKIEAARTIAPHMSAEANASRSFQVLREALTEMTA